MSTYCNPKSIYCKTIWCLFIILGQDRQRRRLREDAIPSKFPGIPAYLSRTIPKRRSGHALMDSRQEQSRIQNEKNEAEFLLSDQVNSFESLANSTLDFPSSWNIVSLKTEESIVLEEISFNEEGKPVLWFSLTIFKSLNFKLVKGGIFLPASKVKHICKNIINRFSEIVNILAYLRADASLENEKCDKVHHCIHLLDSLMEQEEESSSVFKKLNFIRTQLSLVYINSSSRRYSPSFVWTAISWMKSSPALYRLLQSDGLLTLPSCRYLKEISSWWGDEKHINFKK